MLDQEDLKWIAATSTELEYHPATGLIPWVRRHHRGARETQLHRTCLRRAG